MTASAHAPGRVELLGNHTDYNEGLVLAAAIDRGLTMTGVSRDDDAIIIDSNTKGRAQSSLVHLHPLASTRWINYALGVAAELLALDVPLKGFSAQLNGDLPSGSGLSSSAAFELATALFLLKLYPRKIEPLEIAKACQRAEQKFVGVKSGLLDQITSLFGRANHVVFLDCRTEEIRTIPFPSELALIISESGTKRQLVSGAYNERREETRRAAELLRVKALRDVTLPELLARRDLPDLLLRRARHIVEENDRVRRALDLLAVADGAGFGQLMNASHQSSRINFENSTPELDFLVSIAQELPGVFGARLTGGGFGGATVTLCQADRADKIATQIAKTYAEKTGIKARVFVCRIADGAA